MRGRAEYEQIRAVLEQAGEDRPLTAREIADLLEEHDADIDSPHRVATVLGRRARRGEVEVIDGQPYRYRIPTNRSASDARGTT